MVTIGQLRERVTIQQPTRSTDAIGGATLTWSTLVSCWAEVVALSGGEGRQAEAVVSSVSHRLTIRYRSDVVPKMRVSWNSLTLQIHAVVPVLVHGKRWSVLECGATQ